MSRYVKDRTHKVGRPPGEVVFVGEDKQTPVHLSVTDYDKSHFEEHPLKQVEDTFPFRDATTISWINVDGVHDTPLVKQIGEHFDIHPLILEDIVNTGQRPKIEEYEDTLFIIAKMLYLADDEETLRSEQVSLLVGPQYVLSFVEDPDDVFNPVRERLRRGKGRIRQRDADYLAYALLDVIVDHYFIVLESIGERLEQLEEEVLDEPTPLTQHKINEVRRELIVVRRAVWPLREMLSLLSRSESSLVSAETRPYYRDAYDHAVQVIDIVESLREVAGSLIDLYMSNLSHQLNEVMRVLTIIGTIFIPLTFIAGIYGMNFEYMPELHAPYAYPVALLGMLLLAVSLIFYFRRKGWL